MKLEKDKQINNIISKILYFDTLSKVENTFFYRKYFRQGSQERPLFEG